MTKRLAAGLCSAAFGLLLGACGTSLPATHYYVLTAGPAAESVAGNTVTPAVGADRIDLVVETFLVDPPYDQDAVVYLGKSGSGEVGFYSYHRWASPLGRLVAVALAEGLRGAGGLGRVEPAGGQQGARPARVLRGRVVQAGELDRPTGVAARFELEVFLIETSADGREHVAWTHRVVGEAEGTPATVLEFMTLLQQAFDEASGQIRDGLEAHLR